MNRAFIQHTQDIEHLCQIALMLEAETAVLYGRISALRRELATARGDSQVQLELELKLIQERLAAREAELFRGKSERRPASEDPEQDDGSEEEAAADPTRRKKKKGKAPQTGHGPTAQPKLPRVPELFTLDLADQVCPKCGGTLCPKAGQIECSEQIHIIERQFIIRENQRQKYGCSGCGHIEMALGPERLVPGGRYTLELAVEVAAAKYDNHEPLERQVSRMAQESLSITSQSLWDQTEALADVLWPSYEALQDHILAQPCIGVDETWWRVMDKGTSKKWWCWTLVGDDAVFHVILPGRSTEAAKVVLKSYDGIVVCDGYSVYASLEGAATKRGRQRPLLPGEEDPLPDYLLASCWAHVRRGFFKIKDKNPEVDEILDLIGALYTLEANAREGPPEDLLVRRAELRERYSRPVTDQIHAWLKSQRPIPGTGLERAVQYALNRWESLLVFLVRPVVPLDNNHSERALRDLVVGRKNHQGSRSEKGTRVAALFYSLIETAGLCGVNPRTYLLEAARAAIRNPGTVTLPWDLATSAEAGDAQG